jgi:hypothetical protein
MQILDYSFETSSGTIIGYNPLTKFLTNEQIAELDSIGYRGKTTSDQETTRTQYLNSLFPNKELFHIIQTKFDNGDFREKFILVRVIIPQKK